MKSRVKAKSRGKRKRGAPSRAKATASRKSARPRKALKPAPKAAKRSSKADPLDSWIVAGVQGLGLTMEKSWMTAIRVNLRVTLDQGIMVGDYPLSDDAEPAPVFRA